MTTDNRTDFEAWAIQQGYDLNRTMDGRYIYSDTHHAYLAWQAATSLALEKAAAAIENEPAVNALAFAAAIRALKDETK